MKIDLKNKKYFFIILIIIAAASVFFRFWNLTGNDLYSDDALYSFRALGWFDYLGGGQTTPIQWFDSVPGWAKLSFHDAPPLVFAIQNIFFRIFGPNTLAARLPFALAGLGTMVLLYFSVKKGKNRNIALIAVFLLGISSFAVWASRIGYLEGVEVFFITLSVFFFVIFSTDGKKINLCWWGLAAGLSLLCKYTAIFLLPALVLYLLIWQRKIFKIKELWISFLLFLAVLTPIIIYNINMFQTRGHFDAALSSMVGMHPEDFKAISSRGLSFNLGKNALSVFRDALFATSSFPIFLLIIVSFFYLLIKVVRRKGSHLENFVLINLAAVFSMFAFFGAGPRFFSIVTPFLSIILAFFIYDVWQYLKRKEFLAVQKIMILISFFIFVGEIFYNVNTNLFNEPLGRPGIFYSPSRFYNHGFNQLDDYLQNKIFKDLPPSQKITRLADLSFSLADFRGKDMVFFDESINWFAYTWYLQKYSVYYRLPAISFFKYLKIVPADSKDLFALLKQNGITGFYYIYAVDGKVIDPVKKDNPAIMDNMRILAEQLEKAGIRPEEIKNSKGQTAFKAYHVKFKN